MQALKSLNVNFRSLNSSTRVPAVISDLPIHLEGSPRQSPIASTLGLAPSSFPIWTIDGLNFELSGFKKLKNSGYLVNGKSKYILVLLWRIQLINRPSLNAHPTNIRGNDYLPRRPVTMLTLFKSSHQAGLRIDPTSWRWSTNSLPITGGGRVV